MPHNDQSNPMPHPERAGYVCIWCGTPCQHPEDDYGWCPECDGHRTPEEMEPPRTPPQED